MGSVFEPLFVTDSTRLPASPSKYAVASDKDTLLALSKLNTLLSSRPFLDASVERFLAQRLQLAILPSQASPNSSTIEACGQLLSELGYMCFIRQPKKHAAGDDQDLFCLRTALLHILSPGRELVVDLDFKSVWVLPRSTPRYDAMLAKLPPVFVGSPEVLFSLCTLMSHEVAIAFATHDMAVPPWRRAKALVARFLPPHFEDRPICAPHVHTAYDDGLDMQDDDEGSCFMASSPSSMLGLVGGVASDLTARRHSAPRLQIPPSAYPFALPASPASPTMQAPASPQSAPSKRRILNFAVNEKAVSQYVPAFKLQTATSLLSPRAHATHNRVATGLIHVRFDGQSPVPN